MRDAASLAQAVVVLKGDDTLIADPTGAGVVALGPGGSPALATAGTGDVLTGVIAALLAQGLFRRSRRPPPPSSCTPPRGVRRPGTVGSADSVIASDVIAALPSRAR